MAPWNRDNVQAEAEAEERRRAAQEEDNPFIAFRRFADDQFNALVHGLNALPSILTEARTRAEQEQKQWEREFGEHKGKWDREVHDLWKEFTGSDGSIPEEGREAARVLLRQARDANVGVDPRKILSLYRDTEVAWLDSHGSYGSFKKEAPWLSVDWFKENSYSPIQIEQHRHAHQQGSMWRAAFEDLLSAELDKEPKAWEAWTGRVNNQKLYSTWAQTGTDWMLGLQCRGILPPQLPHLYQLDNTRQMDSIYRNIMQGRQSNPFVAGKVDADFERLAKEITTFDDDERAAQTSRSPDTELDAYESFLGRAQDGSSQEPLSCPALKPRVAAAPGVSQTPSRSSEQRPTVLSTLSTTESTTLPDGTVTTRVVLKKRFADGREESSETVSTTHSQQQGSVTSTGSEITEAQAGHSQDEKQQRQQSKGWFWS